MHTSHINRSARLADIRRPLDAAIPDSTLEVAEDETENESL